LNFELLSSFPGVQNEQHKIKEKIKAEQKKVDLLNAKFVEVTEEFEAINEGERSKLLAYRREKVDEYDELVTITDKMRTKLETHKQECDDILEVIESLKVELANSTVKRDRLTNRINQAGAKILKKTKDIELLEAELKNLEVKDADLNLLKEAQRVLSNQKEELQNSNLEMAQLILSYRELKVDLDLDLLTLERNIPNEWEAKNILIYQIGQWTGFIPRLRTETKKYGMSGVQFPLPIRPLSRIRDEKLAEMDQDDRILNAPLFPPVANAASQTPPHGEILEEFGNEAYPRRTPPGFSHINLRRGRGRNDETDSKKRQKAVSTNKLHLSNACKRQVLIMVIETHRDHWYRERWSKRRSRPEMPKPSKCNRGSGLKHGKATMRPNSYLVGNGLQWGVVLKMTNSMIMRLFDTR
jgi:hypothetical protein